MLDIDYIKNDFLDISSISLNPSEILFIRGESGSGKSLFLRSLADIDLNEGKVYLDKQERASIAAPEWRKQLGLLPAQAKWWGERVSDSLQCPDKALKSVMLDKHILNQRVSSLSSGESQRLSLLRLLENKPKILLLDEPTANLDEASGLAVEQVIIKYIQKHSTAAIWISHDTHQVKRVSTQVSSRVSFMVDGKLSEQQHD